MVAFPPQDESLGKVHSLVNHSRYFADIKDGVKEGI